MKAEEIANKARDALSEYCINECSAYCCRKGYLILSKKEMELITNDKENLLRSEGFIRPLLGGKYSVILGNSLGGCPSLKDSKCTIHKNSERPLACKEFPIFISGKQVRISKRCFGAKTGLLYPYIRELISLGYEIV